MGAKAIGSVVLSLTAAFLGGTLLVLLLFFSYFLISLSFQAVILTLRDEHVPIQRLFVGSSNL